MLVQKRMTSNEWFKSTVQKLLHEVCDDRPEKTAIVYRGEHISYKNLQDRVNKLSQVLINLGVRKGDHVGVLPSPTPEFVYLYYAVLQVGAVINPLNLLWGKIEFTGILQRNDPKVIVTVDKYMGRDYIQVLKESIPDLTIKGSEVSSKSIPTLNRLVCCSKEGNNYEGFLNFYELLENGSGYDEKDLYRRISEAKPTDIQFIIQTSGSTGLSKSALWDHRPPLSTAHFAAKGKGYTENDTFMNLYPFYHNSGIYVMNMTLTYCGSTLFLTDVFNPLEAIQLIDKYQITTTSGFDAHFVAMRKAMLTGDYKFTIRKIQGAVMAHTYDMIINEMMKVDETDATVNRVYAQTENGPLVSQCEHDCMVSRIKKHTNGRPVSGVEVVIKDIESGEKLPDGKQGEICYKSPFAFNGYYKQEEETLALYDDEGFIRSGDYGTLEGGYLAFLGRMGGVVKTGGENVSTTYVSTLILELFPDEFEDVLTFGVPDPYWGAKLVSLVRMRSGKKLRNMDDIKQDCKEKMANYEIPKLMFEWDGVWPLTAEGKVNMKFLQLEAEKLATANDKK